MTEFTNQREAVIGYIRAAMQDQGATLAQAIDATTSVYFFDPADVRDLFAAINSDLKPEVIGAIVAHDFNGLADHKECFLPKARQFRSVEV